MAPATGRDVGLRVSTRNTITIWRANSPGCALSRFCRFFALFLCILEMDFFF